MAMVVEAVAEHGGPTPACTQLYQQPFTSCSGIRRRHYWDAVREGTTRYRKQQRATA